MQQHPEVSAKYHAPPYRKQGFTIWVIVKIVVPFWVLNIIRHLMSRVPKRDHNSDNYPQAECKLGSFVASSRALSDQRITDTKKKAAHHNTDYREIPQPLIMKPNKVGISPHSSMKRPSDC